MTQLDASYMEELELLSYQYKIAMQRAIHFDAAICLQATENYKYFLNYRQHTFKCT